MTHKEDILGVLCLAIGVGLCVYNPENIPWGIGGGCIGALGRFIYLIVRRD